MANTYFTNRITRSFKEWDALLAAPKVVFHAPRRVVSKGLTKILIQWKCEDLRKYLGGEILEIVDAGSTRGLELLAKKEWRPWSVLSERPAVGSVILIDGLKAMSPSREVLDLKYIQSCKYIDA